MTFHSGDVVTIDEFGGLQFRIGSVCTGGMGIVYQLLPFANVMTTKAAKTLIDGIDADLFEREAENWFLVGEHPYITSPTWFGKWLDKFCIIMEWYNNKLNDLNVLSLQIESVRHIFRGILEGLHYAYVRVGLIHQDVKPSNILIDSEGNPRIADFGLATVNRNSPLLGTFSSVNLKTKTTISHQGITGTPFYMAPELLNSNGTPSILTDIYSVGVTMYEWLTCEHPYLGPETNFEFVPALRIKPLRRIQEHFGNKISPIIDAIVRSLDLSPSKRPSSYEAALEFISSLSTRRAPDDDFFSAHEVQKLVLIYRNQGKFEKAERLVKNALQLRPEDPLLLNTYARMLLVADQLEQAIALFKEGFVALHKSKGLYCGKPYLDPAMNYAKMLIVSQEYDEAQRVLSDCWKWTGSGVDKRFLEYEELGWYLLHTGDPQNAADIFFHILKYRELGNHALRWYTLSSFWADSTLFRTLAPELSKLWLKANLEYEVPDALAMALCGLYTPEPLRSRIWEILDNSFTVFSEAGKAHQLVEDWYKHDYEDHSTMLAGLLDLLTTGGAYSARYGSLKIERRE